MISRELLIVFVQEYDSKRIKSAGAAKTRSRNAPHPSPVFVQVFISMGLGLTIGAVLRRWQLAVLFVCEEKTLGGRSEADGAVSSKLVDKRGRREAEVWLTANICDYNQEVLSSQ